MKNNAQKTKRGMLKMDQPISLEPYKGMLVFKEYISEGKGYDPAPEIYYARPPNSGKIKWTFIAYTEKDLKKQIASAKNPLSMKRTVLLHK